MKKYSRILALVLIVLMSLTFAACNRGEQSGENTTNTDYPSRTVTLMVPYGAGSSVDINGRAIQPALQEALKQTVVVENKEGGSGAVGCTYVAKQVDETGYYMGIANIASICANAVLGDLEIDPSQDYYFVGCTATDPFMVLVSSQSEFNTLQDLIDYAVDHPGEVTYGATGAMSMDTMTGYDIEAAGNCDLNVVSYSSGNDVIAGIMGGHVQVCGSALSEALPYIESGDLKCIGIGGEKRSEKLPDVPTYDEQGIAMTFQMAKRAIWLPADTDPAVLDILVSALKAAVESDSYKKTCETLSLQPMYLTPDDCMDEAVSVMNFLRENKDALTAGK
ncbi:MAG: Bug family tripartite tricarboxylate transporter substrate binding protein [Peptococcaceae bacterium]